MSTPRGLGIVDRHAQFIGTTGNAARHSTIEAFLRYAPEIALVLGTRMDEASSSWMPELVAPGGFIHVDIDDTAFGRAYPKAATFGVQAEVGTVSGDPRPVAPPRAPRAARAARRTSAADARPGG